MDCQWNKILGQGVHLYQIFNNRLVGPRVINEEGMIAIETAIKL